MIQEVTRTVRVSDQAHYYLTRKANDENLTVAQLVDTILNTYEMISNEI